MGQLLHRVAAEASLLAAWQEVQSNDLDDGRPSSQVSSYAEGILGKLDRLSGELRSGSWRPHPVYATEISKPSGGTRLLAVPHVEDRVVERAVMEVIDDYIDAVLLPWSYAYRKGLGVKDALRDLASARDNGARWVVRADVADCFEDIPRWPVLARLREVVPDTELCLLVQWLTDRHGVGPAAKRIRRGRGLHQGSACSPALANLYLDAFDRELLKAGHRVLRYSDDFAIPVATRAQGEQITDLAQEALRRLDLELNTAKSRIESFDEGVDFLGTVTTSRSGVPGRQSASPLEGTIYVTEPGTALRARGSRLRVTRNKTQLLSVAFSRVRQVVCTTPAMLTTPFLRRALEHDIDLVLVEEDGEFLGRLIGPAGRDVELRHDQHRLADRDAFRLDLARSFISGKISNMRTGILRVARNQALADTEPVAARLLTTRTKATGAESLAELMGHEGTATRDYFTALGRILGPAWAFTHRRRRPPPDPVNAMLSFGYTLLARDAACALELAGLDPAVGYLHDLKRGRPSLALDLMEEFRPLIVDQIVTRLCLSGKVSPAEFTTTDGALGCRMNPATLEIFLGAYEQRMLTIAHHPTAGRRVSYRTALTVQARTIADVITGAQPTYTPLTWR